MTRTKSGWFHGSRCNSALSAHALMRICRRLALALIYSGIDTFGLLAAPPAIQDACGDTFKQWCEKYILHRVQPVEGGLVNAIDLWAAQCGVLHTSTPLFSFGTSRKSPSNLVSP